MAANGKFKPKASSNTLEGVTPVTAEETTPTIPENGTESAETLEVVTPTVTFEDKAPKAPVQKNVKVCLKTNHSCTIGGVTYHFVKGKQTTVPQNVKTILLQAGLLMPL